MSFLAAFLLATAMPMAPGAGVLSLPEAQRRALERSRQLDALDAGIASSRHLAVAAGQLPDPVLRIGVDNVPADGGDRFSLTRDFMTMRRIGVMQEVTRSGKRELRRQRYELEAEKGSAERQAALAAVQRDTAIAWLDRWHLEAMLRAAQDFVVSSEAEVQSADTAYRGGRGAQADVFATRGAVGLAQDRRAEIERRLRQARIELARWTGGSPEEPLTGPPDMTAVALAAGELEQHLRTHPEIVALGRQAAIATMEARIADTARRPDWTWEASFQQRGSAYSNMFSVGVSIPLPWDPANRQDREVAARTALAEEASARRDEMLRAHVAEVAGLLDEWRTGRERSARYRREILPLAVERTRASVAAYAGGKSTLSDVLAARRNEADLLLQAIQIELETAKAWARLAFLLPDESIHRDRIHGSRPQ
ncbi:MAG TPA: TolC family protein [Usitatibacter sp.]|nr:TolC family protein [Usitatibacter sp.]